MDGGPDVVNTTTSTEPPAFILPGLETGVNAALSEFNRQTGGVSGGYGIRNVPPGSRRDGGPSDFAGGTTNPGTLAGGTAPPLVDQGQNLLGQTLGGDFLGPESNPYLQQTFDRAADLTRGRLDSEFAGSGRNLGASMPARSEELQTLASNIYGGNYQAERDRQITGIGQSLEFDPTNMLINRIAGIIPGAGGTTNAQQPVFQQGLFSDRRLKRNINRVGTVKGLPWYEFEYIWGQKSEGFMSDEVPAQHVTKHPTGYDLVDYQAILGG